MQCQICYGNTVTRELTQELCYPKMYTCKDCGSTYIKNGKGLVLLTEKEEVTA